MDLQQLTDFIKEKGRNRFPDPDAVAKAIRKKKLSGTTGKSDGLSHKKS